MARPFQAAYGPFEKAWGTGSFAHLVLRQQVSFRYGLISMTSVRNAVRRFLIYLIRCYRQLRPNRAPCCRYSPSCSEYAIRAITTHGSLKGVLLASWRILRCNPFSKGGYDPVPPKGSWRNKAE